jgi:glycosyltransferase involved in cell wall biosynthesis
LYTRFAGVRPADVIAIWTRVRQYLPDAHLTVAGQGVDGEERELAGESGIDALGWVEPGSLPALFAGMQIAVVPWADTPSNRARHSVKVLELMAAGLPIVAYAVGELPVTLGETGILVPPGNPTTFAQAVLELLTDPERARRLGAAAQLRAHERFAWPQLADVALAAYVTALRTNRE